MNPAKHRILFLGQKPFGEAAWRYIKDCSSSGLRVVAVCTNIDSSRVWWESNGVYSDHGNVSVVDNNIRNTDLLLRLIKEKRINTILSVQHPWILSREILDAVDYNAINFHNARLPQYKGYNAVNHAILNRDKEFVCTAHWMDDVVDEGELVYEASFKLREDETAVSLYAKSFHAGMLLFKKVLHLLIEGQLLPRKKVDMTGGRFYSRKSIEAMREIKSMDELEVKSRAFYFPPFEPAFNTTGDSKIYCLPQKGLELMRAGMGWNLEVLHHFIRATEDSVIKVF